MKRIFTIAICLIITASYSVSAQTFNQFYADLVADVSGYNILTDLTTFESFGVKEIGTTALSNAENWITDRYTSLGYTDIQLQPFTAGGQPTNNIIITKTGTEFPDTFLIIDAHYDTINGPGVNDNGSGTVSLLEMARLLADVDTRYSIKFIHFSGEEDGLLGSSFYVQNTVIPQNLDVLLVFNIDEVGGVSGENNDTITCERDERSPNSNNAESAAMTTILANSIELYTDLNTQIAEAFASDYIPFENNGQIITGLYETNVTPFSHGPNDTLANMDPDYLTEVVKGALGATLHFADARETLGVTDGTLLADSIVIYPNPSKGKVNLKTSFNTSYALQVVDVLGREVYTGKFDSENTTLDLSEMAKGTYLAIFKAEGATVTKKIVLK